MTVATLVAMLLVETQSAPRSVRAPTGAVVKAAPDREARTIGVLGRGATVGFRGEYEGWVAVEPRGWVDADRLELSQEEPTAETPPLRKRSWKKLRRHPSEFEGVNLEGPGAMVLPIAWTKDRRVVDVLEEDEHRRDLRIARQTDPPEGVGEHERWIDVDLTQQVLVAYEGARPVFATLVSTGKRDKKTPLGTFRIKKKKLKTTMKSRPDDPKPYEVPDVPYAMYFHEAYALHGAYWHDGFGRPRSHGCENLAPEDARMLFDWTSPRSAPGWITAVNGEERGTPVRIRRSRAMIRAR